MKLEPTAKPLPERSTERVWQWLLGLRSGSDARCAELVSDPVTQREQACIDLYEEFARRSGSRRCVVAHLGQSIDGFVATGSGDSCFVTGAENLDHLHRMRALADAIVVGAGTLEADDPALTTRRVTGPNPTRVVLAGRRPLRASHRLFTDAAAPTLIVCSGSNVVSGATHGNAQVLRLRGDDARIDPALLIDALAERGLQHLFVEGGGAVASSFLRAGVLDRLQLAIAPVMIGSGRRGISAPAHERMLDCLRPQHRLYRMGADLLFDYDLRAPQPGGPDRESGLQRLR